MFRFTIFLLLFSCSLVAQTDMNAGFKMLEEGSFQQAELFFTDVLKESPLNKTANICLSRAVGLAGDAPRAIEILLNTDKIYPNDYELLLNIGEAYLWNNQASESIKVYEDLVARDQLNYTANLGSANCHFQLKNYDQSLYFIDQAISIDPTNESALNSKKFILLAIASNRTAQFDFLNAIEVLDKILVFKPLDEQALINKGINYINLNKYKQAESVFQLLLENDLDPVQTNLLMSHLSMLKHKDKEAISYATEAMKFAKAKDKKTLMQAGIQKVNALGAAKKFDDAEILILQLLNLFGEKTDIKLAQARLKVWDKEPAKGLELYNEIEDNSYELFMGKAEANIALKENNTALELLNEAIKLNPNSFDALKLKEEILAKKKPSIEFGGNTSSDDGSNKAKDYYARINIPVGYKHVFHIHTGVRTTENPLLKTKANQYQLFVGDRIQLHRLWTLTTTIGAISHQNEEQNRLLNTIATNNLKYQFSKNHSLEIAYNRQSLQYSSDLIKSGLIENRFSTSYQYAKPKRPNFFSQYSRSFLSDGNSNYSIFASAYYEILSFPIIKVGVNATHLSFKENNEFLYFSPEKYQMGEAFLQVGNNYDVKAKFTYSAMIAIGKQRISANAWENTQRAEVQLGYRLKSKYHLTFSYFTNSAATSNEKGYSFERIRAKLVLPL